MRLKKKKKEGTKERKRFCIPRDIGKAKMKCQNLWDTFLEIGSLSYPRVVDLLLYKKEARKEGESMGARAALKKGAAAACERGPAIFCASAILLLPRQS